LTPQEWQALYIREHQTILLPEAPTIIQAIMWLGKLGGSLNRKNDKLPGPTTLWRRYENFKQTMRMLAILTPQNCG
jgi:hypothetical protein